MAVARLIGVSYTWGKKLKILRCIKKLLCIKHVTDVCMSGRKRKLHIQQTVHNVWSGGDASPREIQPKLSLTRVLFFFSFFILRTDSMTTRLFPPLSGHCFYGKLRVAVKKNRVIPGLKSYCLLSFFFGPVMQICLRVFFLSLLFFWPPRPKTALSLLRNGSKRGRSRWWYLGLCNMEEGVSSTNYSHFPFAKTNCQKLASLKLIFHFF